MLRSVTLVLLAIVAAGCLGSRNPLDRFHPVAVDVPPPHPEDDDDRAPWAESEPFAIVVRKGCRTLDVYRFGRRIRSFPAVFGMAGPEAKLYEGDRRTPTGLYMIIEKRPHDRWRHFLLLDYPNSHDVARYRTARANGDVPWRGRGFAGIGGAIGIHGSDKPDLNTRGVDWTLGCISVDNDDVEDLVSLVPVGTLVLIEE